jgi:hypothetical protein
VLLSLHLIPKPLFVTLLHTLSKKVGFNTSDIFELFAVREGLYLACEMGYKDIILEIDSL